MKVIKWLDDHMEEALLVVFLVIICTLMMINVVLRYVFHSGILWGDEFCRQCFIATAFLGAGYCIKKKVLMRLDALQKALPSVASACLEILVDLIMAAAFFYLAVGGWAVVGKAFKNVTKTVIMRMPMYVTYSVVFACYIIATLRAIQKFIEDIIAMIKGRKSRKEGENA